MRALEKNAAQDPATWPALLGGSRTPGNRWKLIFTADTKAVQKAFKGGPGGGSYFPLTAAQRWDAEKAQIENGIFLGHVAALTFTGPYSMKGKILSFDFVKLNLKIGPAKFSFDLKKDSVVKNAFDASATVFQRTKTTPFFVFLYVDEDVCIARGRSGGVAYWARTTASEEAEKGIVSLV